MTAARLAPFIRTYGERERPVTTPYSRNVPAETKAHVKTLLDDAAASARRTMAFLRVRAASRKYFNGGVQFIIATVPDPIDSHAGWQFDPTMGAIEEAAGANEFVLDRFYIPDADTSAPARPGATAATAALHESQPGVVLFRSTAKPLDPARPLVQSLTVVFVVTETPTAGINSRAFAASVRAVSSWDSAPVGAPRPLLILGPYFSGTSHSMALALTELESDIAGRDVRIISGSATGDLNKETLEHAFADSGAATHPHIEFHATVQPDAVIAKTIVGYLAKEVDPQIYKGRPRIARLLESNTSYGVGINAAKPDDPSDEPDYVDLHFPLHISRLRSDTRDRGTAQAPAIGLVSRFRPVALGDESRPTDQLPIFTPKTTTAYVELVLSHILDTIRREQIHIIGIMATDARDKLFLAQQISRDVPNAILYTTESDMLYVHPDFIHATAGMLIASPYPLYSRDRIVTEGKRHERRQFATSSVEGVYNAMLALMKYKPAGPPLWQPIDPPLVDYGAVSDECHKCGPPVWISVVGHGAARPLTASWDQVWSGPAGYLLPYPASAGNDRRTADSEVDARTTIPPATQLLFFGMIVLIAGHMIQAPRIPKDPACDLYVAAASICLLIPWLVLSFITLNWIEEIEGRGLWIFAAAACASVIAALGYLIVTRLIRGKDLLRHRAGWMVGIGVAAWATASLVQWLRHPASHSALFIELFVERVTALTDGVSPAVPVFGLSAVLYLWAVIELRRLARPKILPAEGYDYLESMVDGSLQSLPCGLDYLKRSILSIPPPAVAALAAGAIIALSAAGFDPYWSPLRSMDGPDFGRFVTLLLTTVQLMIVAALFQFLHIWLAIATMLERLATLPTAGAYKRLPRKLFPQGVLPRVPRLSELQEAVRRWDHLEHEDTRPHTSENVTAVFRDDMKRNPHQFWSQTRTWKAVLLEARRILDELSVKGTVASMAVTYPRFVPLSSIGSVGSPVDALPSATRSELFAVSQVAADDLHRFRQEEFVVLPIVYMIRAALARMWDNVLFVIGALLLLLGIHSSYPFQLNRRLEGFLWTDVAVGVAAVLFVFVRMERDEVLSNIRSSTPGQIKWDRDFVVKLVVYGLIPVAGLFAAEFPDIGGAVLGWIQPLQKALP